MPATYEQSIKGRYKSLRLPGRPIRRGMLAPFYCIGIFLADTIIDCVSATKAALIGILSFTIASLCGFIYMAAAFSGKKADEATRDQFLENTINICYACTKFAVLAMPTIMQWAFACLSLVNIIIAIHCTLDFIRDTPPCYSDKDNHYMGVFTHYLTIGKHYCQWLFPTSKQSTQRNTRQHSVPASRLNSELPANPGELPDSPGELPDNPVVAYLVTGSSTENIPVADAFYL